MDDWNSLYHEVCQEIGSFVDLPASSVYDQELKVKDGLVPFPRYQQKIVPEKEASRKIIFPRKHLRNITKPLTKWFLKHSLRKAGHFSVCSSTYDEDPELSHRFLAHENRGKYQEGARMYRFARFIRPFKEKSKELLYGSQLLEKVVLEKDETIAEKMIHFSSLPLGLKDSFANASNFSRNFLIASALSNIPFIAEGGAEMMEAMHDYLQYGDRHGVDLVNLTLISGVISLAISMVGLSYYGYLNSDSLTPKNLLKKGFTPKERRYLLSFPKEHTALEERCEILKGFGFPI